MTTAIPVPSGVDAPAGSRTRAQQDFDRGLREIQDSARPIDRIRPYVRPLSVKLRLGWARIWKNKGLLTGMGLFTTAAAQFGSVPALITAGVAVILAEVLT